MYLMREINFMQSKCNAETQNSFGFQISNRHRKRKRSSKLIFFHFSMLSWVLTRLNRTFISKKTE